MTRKEELKEIIQKARDELSEIEDAEREAENRKLVGKCFVYMNSYGSGDKWPLYQRVIGFDGSFLKVFLFQQDNHGKIEIEEETRPAILGEQCSLSEFKAAWKKISKRALTNGEKAVEFKP